MITVEKTILDGVLKITYPIFRDHRGQYKEVYNERDYEQFGVHFIADDISISTHGVLRGIHGDNNTWKLVSCPFGAIQLVVVDCLESRNFGQWESFDLNQGNGLQILIPPNYGNAHLVLSDQAIFQYKQSEYYNPKDQFSYRYDDRRFGIKWQMDNPILSKRDAK